MFTRPSACSPNTGLTKPFSKPLHSAEVILETTPAPFSLRRILQSHMSEEERGKFLIYGRKKSHKGTPDQQRHLDCSQAKYLLPFVCPGSQELIVTQSSPFPVPGKAHGLSEECNEYSEINRNRKTKLLTSFCIY